MPSPRQIAESTNDRSKFDSSADTGYDGIAGAPTGVSPQGPAPDYAADPTLPPDLEPLPARNLKR